MRKWVFSIHLVTKLPFGVNINDLIDDLKMFSWEASEILLYYSQILKDSNYKRNIIRNDNKEDPVTIADLKVNKIIIKRIKEKYKDINWEILSEENVKKESHNCDIDADWMWVLDPLDGTKDFIQGTGNYAMHLALNYKKSPYLGVVLIPEKNELWISDGDKVWGERKDGSFIKTKIARKNSLKSMILVTSKNHSNPTLKKVIDKIKFQETIIMGSIGCKVASILRGDSDIYISLSLPGKSAPKDWDFAAPETILRCSGGAITNINNEDLIYCTQNFEQGGIIVASNNSLKHEDVCMKIREIIKKYDIYSS